MKRLHFLFILILFSNFSSAQVFNPQIDSLVNKVSLDSLIKHVRILSGEDSINIDGNNYLINNRLSNAHIRETNEHKIASKYLIRCAERYLPEVIEQKFYFREDTIRNIIAIQEGKVHPEKKIIISGHYDSISWTYKDTAIAPGADDNASGVAVVLEAIRLLSQIETDYTVYYIFWDWEEDGCLGSENFVFEDTTRTDLLAMINLDMIAYDSLDSGIVDVYCEDTENPLIDVVSSVNFNYNAGLTLKFWYFQGPSDTMPFGFVDNLCRTLLISERFWKYNYNTPYYHTINDKIENFNMSYFHKIAKLGIATTAELSLNGLVSSTENESVLISDKCILYQMSRPEIG
ncbi:MAG: M28 family metallopeptidase [Candidatus Neomarinimicrobiota bacterium]